jgi:CBS domain containing-hemolysin-like protein
MEWMTDPTVWVGLATLILLEIVLGVDNLIFIAILAGRLPERERERARRIGLSLALFMRLGLLAGISWVMSLTKPVFTVLDHAFSWRDLILIAGGLFLLVKATTEMHERLEAQPASHAVGGAGAFWPIVAQIIVLDIVFSLDSIITAVGMVDEVYVMMAAVVISVGVMLVAAKPLSDFITARPTLIVLCLGFLLMIGLVLVADGFGIHIPKGYVYAAIGFSVLIEALNQLATRNRRKLAESLPPRQLLADSVLRMLGGVPLYASDTAAVEAAQATAPRSDENVFTSLERRMVRGVLDLSRRPVKAIMTHRANVEWIDASADRDVVVRSMHASTHREFPLARGSIDKFVGIVRKEDVLALERDGKPFEPESVMREPVATLASAKVLDVLELFKREPVDLAIVVDEYGGFEGIVTRSDLLEAIAGDLPDTGDQQPAVSTLADGSLSLEGAMMIADFEDRLRLQELPEGTYHTAAGFVLAILGRLPKSGDVVEWDGWRFEVMEMDGMTVKRLIARRIA